MKGLKRYQSFHKAREDLNVEAYQRPFDPERAKKFLQQFPRHGTNPYRLGLYRFPSFQTAREFDQSQYLKQALEKK